MTWSNKIKFLSMTLEKNINKLQDHYVPELKGAMKII